MKDPAIYILASKQNGTLYIGSTDNLKKRIYQHKNELLPGFTQKYGVKKLVYFEQYDLMTDAALREKQLKRNNLGTSFTFVPNKSESGRGDYILQPRAYRL